MFTTNAEFNGHISAIDRNEILHVELKILAKNIALCNLHSHC